MCNALAGDQPDLRSTKLSDAWVNVNLDPSKIKKTNTRFVMIPSLSYHYATIILTSYVPVMLSLRLQTSGNQDPSRCILPRALCTL
jgi:hypothetical protein